MKYKPLTHEWGEEQINFVNMYNTSKELRINRPHTVERTYTPQKYLDVILRIDKGPVVVRGTGTQHAWDTCVILETGRLYALNTEALYIIGAIQDSVVTELCRLNTVELTKGLLDKLDSNDLSDLLKEEN